MTLVRHGAYLVTNALLYSALWPTHRTIDVRWSQSFDDLERDAAERPVLFCSLHRYGYLLFMVFGRQVPASMQPRVIGHDGHASRMQTRAGVWAGYPLVEFKRQSLQTPRGQLIEHLRGRPGPVALLPDSGGPYGTVKPGVIEIASATDAVIVPWAARCIRGCVTVGRTMRHVVPLPFGRVEVARGRTLRAGERTRAALQSELDALEERVAER